MYLIIYIKISVYQMRVKYYHLLHLSPKLYNNLPWIVSTSHKQCCPWVEHTTRHTFVKPVTMSETGPNSLWLILATISKNSVTVCKTNKRYWREDLSTYWFASHALRNIRWLTPAKQQLFQSFKQLLDNQLVEYNFWCDHSLLNVTLNQFVKYNNTTYVTIWLNTTVCVTI